MKIRSTFHVSVLLMAVLTFSMPFVTFAQQNSVDTEARAAAEQDANSDVNKLLWFGTGAGLAAIGCAVGNCVGGAVDSIINPDQLFGIGTCIGSAVGVFVPFIGIYNHQAKPPPERLLGKSPEYIEFYTDAYAKKTRSIRIQSAAAGAAGACGIAAILLVGVMQSLPVW